MKDEEERGWDGDGDEDEGSDTDSDSSLSLRSSVRESTDAGETGIFKLRVFKTKSKRELMLLLSKVILSMKVLHKEQKHSLFKYNNNIRKWNK